MPLREWIAKKPTGETPMGESTSTLERRIGRRLPYQERSGNDGREQSGEGGTAERKTGRRRSRDRPRAQSRVGREVAQQKQRRAEELGDAGSGSTLVATLL